MNINVDIPTSQTFLSSPLVVRHGRYNFSSEYVRACIVSAGSDLSEP